MSCTSVTRDSMCQKIMPSRSVRNSIGALSETEFVRDSIAGDQRFFEPAIEIGVEATDAAANYNYNENQLLEEAIQNGARGAYWDILR